MPISRRNRRPVLIEAGARTASAKVALPRFSPPPSELGQRLSDAFQEAWKAFETEHGRPPNYDSLNLLGGIMSFEVILEIVES